MDGFFLVRLPGIKGIQPVVAEICIGSGKQKAGLSDRHRDILKSRQIIQVIARVAVGIGTQMKLVVPSAEHVQVPDFFVLNHLLSGFVIYDLSVVQLKLNDITVAIFFVRLQLRLVVHRYS
ncbi:hypothetical protein XI25_22630 [Paenibacillus sp. DMB20]|nr:hypothetical protein XI25_22630 [Paenibacillus sp. DMB20]